MNKKNDILNVVISLLSNPDNKPLSIAFVAKEVGIGKSTIYEYFDKKDDLIIGAVELMIKRNIKHILEIDGFASMNFKASFTTHFKKLLEVSKSNEMMQNYIYHPDISMLASDKKRDLMQKMHETFEKIKKRLDEILDKGIQEGLLKSNITQSRKQTIEATIFGALLAITDPLNQWDEVDMIKDVYDSVVLLHQ